MNRLYFPSLVPTFLPTVYSLFRDITASHLFEKGLLEKRVGVRAFRIFFRGPLMAPGFAPNSYNNTSNSRKYQVVVVVGHTVSREVTCALYHFHYDFAKTLSQHRLDLSGSSAPPFHHLHCGGGNVVWRVESNADLAGTAPGSLLRLAQPRIETLTFGWNTWGRTTLSRGN